MDYKKYSIYNAIVYFEEIKKQLKLAESQTEDQDEEPPKLKPQEEKSMKRELSKDEKIQLGAKIFCGVLCVSLVI